MRTTKKTPRGDGLIQHQGAPPALFDPFRCRMWAMHDRMDETITDKSCRAEIESFRQYGQLVPALGRPVHGDPDCDVELIYGARRLFIARHLKMPLAVNLQALTDKEALIAMDIENRHRTDISALERGRSYARWLRSGQFLSQDDLARTLGVSSAQMSRLLKIARLPSVLVAAFANPADILERWGLDLYEAWVDPTRRQAMAAKARHLGAQTPRPEPRLIYQALLSTKQSPRALSRPRDRVVTGRDGRALFRVKYQHKAIVLWLPTASAPLNALEEITRHVAEVLQRESVQDAERSPRIRNPLPRRSSVAQVKHVSLAQQFGNRVDSCERSGTQ